MGVLDEWLQSMVPGRTASPMDVLADVAGAGFAVFMCFLGNHHGKKVGLKAERQSPRMPQGTFSTAIGIHLVTRNTSGECACTENIPWGTEKTDWVLNYFSAPGHILLLHNSPDVVRPPGDKVKVVPWGIFSCFTIHLMTKPDKVPRRR